MPILCLALGLLGSGLRQIGLIILWSALACTAETYYVATTGNDTSNGTTADTAWRHLAYAVNQAVAGDTVYVKAGNYGAENVVFPRSGTATLPITVEGYRTTPGDAPDLGYDYGESLDPAVMPLLDGGNRAAGIGLTLNSRSYIRVRNFQIRNYALGVEAYGTDHIEVRNLTLTTLGDIAVGYDGFGLAFTISTNFSILDCTVVNAAAEAIRVGGNDGLVYNCRVFADDATNANSPTDYYIIVLGHRNTIRNCVVKRYGALSHPGHGIGFKGDSTDNKVINCASYNTSEAFHVNHRACMRNEFIDCTGVWDPGLSGSSAGLVVRNGAQYNVFNNCSMTGGLSSVTFWDDSEDGINSAGSFNVFKNCRLEAAWRAIWFDPFTDESPANDNDFINCLFIGGATTDALYSTGRSNYNTRLINSIITGFPAYVAGDSTAFPINATYTYSTFWNNGFAMPVGTGNQTADPLFANAASGDYHLKSAFGRWNPTQAAWLIDAFTSPCLDAGDPDFSHNLEPNGNGGRINQGIYGNTRFASRSALPSTSAITYPPDATLSPTTMPSVSRPGYLSPIIDPVFGTTVMRVSDQGAPFNSSEQRLSHNYAKNQVWNSNGTRVLLNWTYPAPVLDGATFAFRGWVRQPGESMWLNTDSRYVIGCYQNDLNRVEVDNDTLVTLKTFSEYDSITMGNSEGNLSADDKWLVMIGRKGSDRVVFVYDMVNQTVTARMNIGNGPINNATVSQSGTYVVVEWDVNGLGNRQGIEVFDRTFNNLGHLSKTGEGHYDLGYDTSGREVIVVTGDTTSALVMRRLSDLVVTELIPASQMSWNIHVSCRNLDRPGWAYISEFRGGTPVIKDNTQLTMAVKLDGSGTVENFAHEHRSDIEAYERSAMSVPNRDGSTVMFASDWMDGNGPIHAYVAYQAPVTANTAPTVNAGPDRSVSMPNAISLVGTVSDDGRPSGSTVTQTWSTDSGPGTVTFTSSSAVSTSATFSASGTYVIRLTASDGMASASDTVTVTVIGIPTGWTTQDLGAVNAAGSASESSGTWTVRGSGADIWGTADEFQFVAKPVTGDVMITAQVTALTDTDTDTDAWAKAGVMLRQTLDAGSCHASTMVSAGNGASYQRRTSTNGASAHTAGPLKIAPYWVRLERIGNVVTSSSSTNGTTWKVIRTHTINLGASIHVGLAVTSHNDGHVCTATFSHVQVVYPAAAAD